MTDPDIIPPEPETPKRQPVDFTEEIFQEICERMAGGKGLREICSDPNMPTRFTFLRWVEKDTGRAERYQRARESLMDWYSEEILTIAWDDSKDTITGKDGEPKCNHEWINRSRLKVDTLKFLMAKLHPRRYGDKLPETGAATAPPGPLEVTWLPSEPKRIERIVLQGVTPIWDDNDNLMDVNDPAKLRARIIELEQRLGLRDAPPAPPKLLTYDPGPLPSRMEGEILLKFVALIKENVPKADQRPPEEVLDEALTECAKALQAKYQQAPAEDVA